MGGGISPDSLIMTIKLILLGGRLTLVAMLLAASGLARAGEKTSANPEAMRSPVNQVFQFMHSAAFEYSVSNKVSATTYLWIPDHCRRLRGLLILGRNVPEHTLVGHPAIRAACAANDLGIFWSTPSYYSSNNKDAKKTTAFLQQLLTALAEKSGYDEVATVPWLPIGESMHLGMVNHLLDAAPQRCVAGIYVKNASFNYKNRETPVLMSVGTSQEWDQEKTDIRTRWQNVSFSETLLKERAAFPNWPASLLVDGGSGHFECPEVMVRYFASYITAVAKTRMPTDSKQGLLPVTQNNGWLVGLPLPGQESFPSIAYDKANPDRRNAPWFLNERLASEAFNLAAINWKAETQMPAFKHSNGTPMPMAYRGITRPIPIQTGADGVTFELKGCLLPAIPTNFVAAGTPLARAPGSPSVEWVCGAVAPLGQDKFRIALDRTWPGSPIYVAVRHKGNAAIRSVVEPGSIDLIPNSSGAPQAITFAPIPDQPAGKIPISLNATSDSGMPVEFFVVAGPAIVKNGNLELTPIPPRTRFPITVTVTAWQWGRAMAPQIQTAKPVTQSFHLTKSRPD